MHMESGIPWTPLRYARGMLRVGTDTMIAW